MEFIVTLFYLEIKNLQCSISDLYIFCVHFWFLLFLKLQNLDPSKKRVKNGWQIETKFFRRTAGYTLFDHTKNEEIVEALTVEPVNKK